MALTHRQIAKRFDKSTLLDIAGELDIKADESDKSVELVAKIENDMATNGIVDGDVSDPLFDIMVAMEFIDKDGNILEEDEEAPEKGEETEEAEEKPRPQCFGLCDESDPACARCKQGADCLDHTNSVTISNQPCWGDYDPEDPDCETCVMWRRCKATQ